MERFFALALLIDAIVPATAALLCGLALGTERELNRHAAGLRTLALICFGSCLFTMAGRWLAEFPIENAVVDPGRLASYVIVGIGFLGAGPIITRTSSTEGLTTAASIWSTAAIGVLAGLGFVQTAIAGTVIILVVLWGLRSLASRLRGDQNRQGQVALIISDHLALTRVRLLMENNPLINATEVDAHHGQWHLRLSFCGDEEVLNNLLESIAAIPGVRGANAVERVDIPSP